MKRHWMIGALGLVLGFGGCSSDEPERIEPASRGQRGEVCQARNDCQAGLACISGVCSKNDFNISVAANHCERIECEVDEDCCGDRPMTVPAECVGRDTICNSQLPGCSSGTICTSDESCGSAGTCEPGYCSLNTTVSCTDATQCVDTCVAGICSLSSFSCIDDTDCYGESSCTTRFCDCTNPSYDPTNPICTDPNCLTQNLCRLRCQDSLCITDTSCQSDVECFAPTSICNEGRCVQCTEDAQCDEDNGETCSAEGLCKRPCKYNEECPFFHECVDGACIESGCKSDRECILAAQLGGDGRLFQCLPSDDDPEVKTCKIPCENDGACSQFEVCENGYCKFIGCEDDEECRTYLGLQNEVPTDSRPFVTRAVCLPPE